MSADEYVNALTEGLAEAVDATCQKQIGETAIENGGNVVPLTTGVVTGPTLVTQSMAPVERVVDHCKRLLADAESGKIRAIAYALVERDDLSEIGSINWGFANERNLMFSLDAAISSLRRKWDQGLTDDEKP